MTKKVYKKSEFTSKNMNKKQKPQVKQIIKDTSITLRLTEQQTITLVREKIPSIKISCATLYNVKREIKEENKQWFDMLAMSRYGFVEEYKELIETEKLALSKAFEIVNDPLSTKLERNSALGKINDLN